MPNMHPHPRINDILHRFVNGLGHEARAALHDLQRVATEEGVHLAEEAGESLAKVGGVALEHLTGGPPTADRVAQAAAAAGVDANIPGGAFLDIGALFPDIIHSAANIVGDIIK